MMMKQKNLTQLTKNLNNTYLNTRQIDNSLLQQVSLFSNGKQGYLDVEFLGISFTWCTQHYSPLSQLIPVVTPNN